MYVYCSALVLATPCAQLEFQLLLRSVCLTRPFRWVSVYICFVRSLYIVLTWCESEQAEASSKWKRLSGYLRKSAFNLNVNVQFISGQNFTSEFSSESETESGERAACWGRTSSFCRTAFASQLTSLQRTYVFSSCPFVSNATVPAFAHSSSCVLRYFCVAFHVTVRQVLRRSNCKFVRF